MLIWLLPAAPPLLPSRHTSQPKQAQRTIPYWRAVFAYGAPISIAVISRREIVRRREELNSNWKAHQASFYDKTPQARNVGHKPDVSSTEMGHFGTFPFNLRTRRRDGLRMPATHWTLGSFVSFPRTWPLHGSPFHWVRLCPAKAKLSVKKSCRRVSLYPLRRGRCCCGVPRRRRTGHIVGFLHRPCGRRECP
jgi:hypothetical protein